jgi:hypothetical protein
MKPNKQPVYTGAGARRSRLLAQDRRADPLSAMSACGPSRRLVRCNDPVSGVNRKCVTQTKNDAIDPKRSSGLAILIATHSTGFL